MAYFRAAGEYELMLRQSPRVLGSIRRYEVDFAKRSFGALISFTAVHFGPDHPLGLVASELVSRVIDVERAPISVARHAVAARCRRNWLEGGAVALRVARRCIDGAVVEPDDIPLAESFWFFMSFAVPTACRRPRILAELERSSARPRNAKASMRRARCTA